MVPSWIHFHCAMTGTPLSFNFKNRFYVKIFLTEKEVYGEIWFSFQAGVPFGVSLTLMHIKTF